VCVVARSSPAAITPLLLSFFTSPKLKRDIWQQLERKGHGPTSICIYSTDAFACRRRRHQPPRGDESLMKMRNEKLSRCRCCCCCCVMQRHEERTHTHTHTVWVYIHRIEFNWASTWVTGPETLSRLVQPVVPQTLFFPCFPAALAQCSSSFFFFFSLPLFSISIFIGFLPIKRIQDFEQDYK
jgi:hypothetical protein